MDHWQEETGYEPALLVRTGTTWFHRDSSAAAHTLTLYITI
jgi:hypothetical protein